MKPSSNHPKPSYFILKLLIGNFLMVSFAWSFIYPNKDNFNQGLTYYTNHQYRKAIESFKKANDYDPENPNILNALANSYYKVADFKQSDHYYQKALKILPPNDPLRYQFLYNLGNNYFRLEQFDQAIKNYQAALDHNDQDRPTKRNLEIALKKLEEQKNKDQKQKNSQNNQNPQKPQKNQNKNNPNTDQQKSPQSDPSDTSDQKNNQNKDNDQKNPKQNPGQNPSEQKNGNAAHSISLERAEEILKSFSEKETQYKNFKFYKEVKSKKRNQKNW